MSATCETCRYGFLNGWSAAGNKYVACHRNAPARVESQISVTGAWPVVNASDWCGEHHPLPERTGA